MPLDSVGVLPKLSPQETTLVDKILRAVPLFEEEDEKPKYFPDQLIRELTSLSSERKREVIRALWAYGSVNLYNHFFNKLRCPEAYI